ncbi:allantoinase AllB [Cellulomonas sp. Leaf395]|uniref:allantoinase AllB n=1 Tax=Cellulomonas sp. Leaf395 TaxID=1736362 RepID=UPI0006F84F91|nr:allantoinase AllB [Cellulomonas sp. Leaf395]KQS98839.1 allantoinase [Cellulomonas sp. Leaf395]
MTEPDLVVRARRAWVDGTWRAAQVAVTDGRITALDGPVPAGVTVVDLADDEVLLPGLVDSHVHVNEPGRTAWEGFASATRAAAAGGVTTLVDMPLNSIPPTTTVEALATKRAAAAGKLSVDVAFWGGAVPENLGSLGPLHAAGVRGFKAFLTPSGVDEFGHLDPGQLEAALTEVAALGSVLVVHAEDPADLRGDGALGERYADFLASRPAVSERHAIGRVIDAVRRTGARAHVLHLSDAGSLDLVRSAKAEGLPLTVETCPHYLALRAEDVPSAATQFKCCPPIRDAGNQDLLWAAVLDATIDAIVSDHSPSTADLKNADFGLSWGGIAGLQLGLSVVWTEARRRGIDLDVLLPLLTTGPARVAGLDAGRLAVGAPAHLVAFAPDEQRVVDVHALEHRNAVSPYDGATLTGTVRTVWLHGETIVRSGAVTAPGRGRARA